VKALVLAVESHICENAVLSKALEVRGIKTLNLICGGGFMRCELSKFEIRGQMSSKERKRLCSYHQMQYEVLKNLYLPFIEINKFMKEEIITLLKEWRMDKRIWDYKEMSYDSLNLFEIVRPTVCRVLRSDIIEDRQDNLYMTFDYMKQAVLFIEIFKEVYKRLRPDVVIIFNGMLMRGRIAYELAHRHGIRTITWEMGLSTKTYRFDDQGLAVLSERAEREYERNRDKTLTSKEREELRSFLYKRSRRENIKTPTLPPFHNTQPKDVRTALNIPNDKKIATLFTTVSWDTGQVTRRMIHKSILDWLSQTIEIFRENSEYYLVIRIHPGEATKGERVPIVKRLKNIVLPENVVVIPPENLIDSYILMDVSSFGIVSVSTAGLEMVLRHKPVVCVGIAHYSGKGFTYDAKDERDYRELLNSLMRNPVISDEMFRKAEIYAHYFFCKFSIPFPRSMDAVHESNIHNLPVLLLKQVDFIPGMDEHLDSICDLIIWGAQA